MRCLQQPLTFQNIVLEICRIQSYELYYAKANSKAIKHWKKWAPLYQEYYKVFNSDYNRVDCQNERYIHNYIDNM